MAFVTEFVCSKCEQPRHEVVTHDRICGSCRASEGSRKRRTHLASLKGLTLKERIERIEEQLYDLDLRRRIEALESHHIRY